MIAHPYVPGWFKIGKTVSLEDRLRKYQTADPFRSYRYLIVKPSDDCGRDEYNLLTRLSQLGHTRLNEWVRVPLCVLVKTINKEL